MNNLLERCMARMDSREFGQYWPILRDDLSALLNGHDVSFLLFEELNQAPELSASAQEAIISRTPARDPDAGRVYLPVVINGQTLALVTVAAGPDGSTIEPEETLWDELVRLSLEKILLYKAIITDPETGLYNTVYFQDFARKALRGEESVSMSAGQLTPLRLDHAPAPHRVTLVLAEIRNFHEIARTHGRVESINTLESLADRIRSAFPKPSCLARLDAARLGVVLLQEEAARAAETIRELLAPVASPADLGHPRLDMVAGLAEWPSDTVDVTIGGEPSSSASDDPVNQLVSKAELALHQALTDEMPPVSVYRDILTCGGRVVQALPFGRVVINLGRSAGAREGQAFILASSSPESPVGYKGEVVLFDVREDFAIGEVVKLRRSMDRVQAGDRLELKRDRSGTGRLGAEQGERLDSLLGIPDHTGFINLLAGQAESESVFAVMIARIDGYDKFRVAMGHIESDRHLRTLHDFLRENLPKTAVIGRYSGDSLAVFGLGWDSDTVRNLAEKCRDRIAARLRLTCTFGVAAYPTGSFDRSEILGNAHKALDHASFFGPSSVALFDALSLNVSGDKRFESGDYEGAIQEYNRGLELKPDDLNLLNSLGVCYGYQKEFDRAMEIFSRVLNISPDDLMGHYNRGFVLAMNNRFEEALEDFRAAARIEPDHFDVQFQRGKIALELDRVDEAVRSFSIARDLPDKKSIVYRYLGLALLKSNRPEEAMDAFKAAARHDPNDAMSLSQLGVLMLQSAKDLEVAVSLIRQSVSLDPENGLFRYRLGKALAEVGRFKESEKAFREAIEMGLKSREAHFELGQVVEHLGRLGTAVRHFRDALAVDSQYAPATEALARLSKEIDDGQTPEPPPNPTDA